MLATPHCTPAIFYTGAVRTAPLVLPYVLSHVIAGRKVFACVQASPECPDPVAWLRAVMGDALVSCKIFDPTVPPFADVQRALLAEMALTPAWTHYLRTSGSMMEHWQYARCWAQMLEYEAGTPQFNAVVRLRTDVVYTRPFPDRFPQTSNNQSLLDIMQGWLCSERATLPKYAERMDSDEGAPMPSPENWDRFLLEGRWMVAVRQNLFTVASRAAAEDICQLATQYGRFRSAQETEHWFDSENQLHSLCRTAGIRILNLTTDDEASSLYAYDRARFFDWGWDREGLEHEYLKHLPSVLVFIRR